MWLNLWKVSAPEGLSIGPPIRLTSDCREPTGHLRILWSDRWTPVTSWSRPQNVDAPTLVVRVLSWSNGWKDGPCPFGQRGDAGVSGPHQSGGRWTKPNCQSIESLVQNDQKTQKTNKKWELEKVAIGVRGVRSNERAGCLGKKWGWWPGVPLMLPMDSWRMLCRVINLHNGFCSDSWWLMSTLTWTLNR